MDRLERKKAILEKREDRIKAEKKLLKEKEQQRRAKKCFEVGQIAGKAGIDQIDKHLLLGAFLEICDKFNDLKNQDVWKNIADDFEKISSERKPVSISFQADPTNEVKARLRKAGFRWNRFRSEFVGYGDKSEIEHLLSGENFELEILS